MALTYRREIDGLRAIAVAAVVLYHAGVGPAAGFVGVDVFFVISGYLITALLLRERDTTGRIDLADFYARRVRRIFPALLTVILAVLATVPLLPETARDGVMASAAAAALFVANLFFAAQTSGYFTGDASQFPLLHLWSLAVEEQFYLLWPLLLFVLPRKALVPVLACLAVASFALAEWLLQGNPSAAFYQMPARFWELAAGGLIAAMPSRPLPRWTAPAGVAVALAACALPMGHFPGVGALPAVLGACAVIAAVHGGRTNAFLASRPMVGLGLISYSLYLWHWPLLAIDCLTRVGESSLAVRLALVAVSVLLAVLSYRYIETPLRRPWRISSRSTVAAGFAGMAMLCAGAWAWRTPEPPAPVVFVAKCHPFNPAEQRIQRPACFGKEAKVVLWGDSTAHAWSPMAQEIGKQLSLPVTTFARDGCPPIAGVTKGLRSEAEAASCREWNAKAIAYLQANGADTVVLSARWENFLPADGLAQSVAAIAPHVRRILVIGPTPTLPDNPAKCRALGSDCALARDAFDDGAMDSRMALGALDHPKVAVIDPAAWLCDADACRAFRDGTALYDDTIHVSRYAAATFGRQVARN